MNAISDVTEHEASVPLSTSSPSIGRIVAGAALAFGASLFLTLWAHVLICLGVHPESVAVTDELGPLIGISLGAFWVGHSSKINSSQSWSVGFSVAILLIALWFVQWSYVSSRFQMEFWWHESIMGLTWRHGVAWMSALLVGTGSGIWGARWQNRKRVVWSLSLLSFICLTLITLSFVRLRIDPNISPSKTLSAGMSIRVDPPTRDGTVVYLLTCDLVKEPQLGFNLYDADSDDAKPYDDRNSTWLWQGVEPVFDKLQPRLPAGRQIRCIVNGGFFGADDPWIGNHEAPLVMNGKAFYNTHTLENDWPEQAYTFGISHIQTTSPGTSPYQFHIVRGVPWNELSWKFECALGGVRPLRINGKSLILKPGMGGTTLRCSRTSVAWSADSRYFYVLSVRDPDGEVSSIRQRNAKQRATGGWDVHQVQQFWEQMKISNAVLFDGGESTQLAFQGSNTRYLVGRSSYHISRTLAVWNDRPLRLVLPMYPAVMNHGGVLNYFAIDGPDPASS